MRLRQVMLVLVNFALFLNSVIYTEIQKINYSLNTGLLRLLIFISMYKHLPESLHTQMELVENALEKQEEVSMTPTRDYQCKSSPGNHY